MNKLLLLTAVAFFLPFYNLKANTLDFLRQEINKKLSTSDEQYELQMTIIEDDGSQKNRNFKIWRKSPNKDQHYILVRVLKPLDFKDIRLLFKIDKKQDLRWVYLPSTRQTRRITGEESKGGILGSDLYVEDFDFDLSKKIQSKLLKSSPHSKDFYVVESLVDKSSKNYSKTLLYIDKQKLLPTKIECFNKKSQLFKIVDFRDYKLVSAGKWRAQKIVISNSINNRTTNIQLTNILVNRNLDNDLFEPQNLRED